jgi:predicted dehydrogenase
MPEHTEPVATRRAALASAGTAVAATALAGVFVPDVHAGVDDLTQIALVGCGGRGTGAGDNALASKAGRTKIVAMADVNKGNLQSSYETLYKKHEGKVDVPPDRQFVDFAAGFKAMDCLKAGDLVILATPPAFRWVHFRYAIDKGLHVFMEKPISVDGGSTRRMLALGEESVKKGLKVGVGLMCRHCESRKELFKRIKDGQIGDLLLLRAYRLAGRTASCFTEPRVAGKDPSELLWQIKNFHSFLWASGGSFSDFLIHNIDECCWMKDAWPVKAVASGGRHYRGKFIDQNLDTYNVEYTFADGAKLYMEGRCVDGARQQFSSLAHGTKGCAVISDSGHAPSKARIYAGQNFSGKPEWRCPAKEPSPYQLEWDNLLTSIRENRPHNEVQRGAMASVVTALGRLAAHTGREWTLEQALNHEHEFSPDTDKLTMDGPAPILANSAGQYPVPRPGRETKREYGWAEEDAKPKPAVPNSKKV